jgi:hypothetical protein
MNNHKDLLDFAVSTARAVGLDLKHVAVSHDPYGGYDRSTLVEAVGEEDVAQIASLYQAEAEAVLKNAQIEVGSCVVGLRGKAKGLKGWVCSQMPSQYDSSELAYLVISLDPSKESAWVKGKSLKLRAPERGEVDLLDQVNKAHAECVEWGRGSAVSLKGRRGVLVGFGKKESFIGQVCVQWVDTGESSWVLPNTITKG